MLIFALILAASMLLSIAVGGFIFYCVVKRYFDNQQKTQMLQMRIDEHCETAKMVTPLRLQAYERMALYLERIAPESLVLRCYQPGMEAKALQNAMTRAVRDEWEHNLSQQVYLSDEVWARIRKAKEELIGIINSAAITMPANADPARLASSVFATAAAGALPTAEALAFLKKEAREL